MNEFVWGIVHEHPDPDSFFEPNQLRIDSDGDEDFYVGCANCHLSDDWFLDKTGALYWCFSPPLAESFSKKIERDAVGWQLQRGLFLPLKTTLPASDFIAALVPRIEEGRIDEASDSYETLYLHGGIYAAVSGTRITAFLVDECGRSLCKDLPVSVKA